MHLRLLDFATTTASTATTQRRPFSAPAQHAVERSSAPGAPAIRFWRPLPQKAVDVICGEGTVLGAPLQAHEALQILLPTSWAEVVDGSGRSRLVGPRSIHLTSPLELHAIRGVGSAPVGLRVLLVAPAMLTGPGRASGTPFSDAAHAWAQRVADDPDVHLELSALFDELRRPLVALDCAARLIRSLDRLLGGHADARLIGRERVVSCVGGAERARDHLRAHIPDAVSLDELAAVAGLSKFYLLRAFRRAFGLTPHAYQMQLRLARARRLIADGHSLSYVTYEAGFADQSHLTRRFAAFFGLTPARFARQLATAASHAPAGASVSHQAATPPTAA
jgi:AraC-like DNA-binding protein